MEAKIIVETWQAVLATVVLVVGVTAWLIRLESKILWLDRDRQDSKDEAAKVWVKFDAMQVTLNSLLQSFGRLEGKIDAGSTRTHTRST